MTIERPAGIVLVDWLDAYPDVTNKYGRVIVTDEDVEKYRKEEAAHAAKAKTRLGFSDYFSCRFKLFGELVGLEKIEPERDPAWDYGNVRAIKVHDAWQGALSEIGLLQMVPNWEAPYEGTRPAFEMWVNREMIRPDRLDLYRALNFAGRLDGILTGWIGLEIKTLGDKDHEGSPFFKKKLEKWDKQCQIAMWSLGLDRFRLVLIQRNGSIFQDFYELDVSYDPEWMEKIIPELLELWEMVDNYKPGYKYNKLPPAEFWKDECRFCPFRNTVCPASEYEKRVGPVALKVKEHGKKF